MKVFITGGLTGMGLEVSKMYLKNGAQVGICSFEKLDDIKDILTPGVDYYQADVTNEEAMKTAINSFHEKHGCLDLVLANAGINMVKAKIPDFKRGRQVFNINVIGVINTFEPAIEIMKVQKSGQLAALGSISGITGMPGMACYGASKAAVMSLCESLEVDLHHYGIKVTTLAPGFVATPLTSINNHKMPFLMSQEEAANKIYTALKRKKGLYVFPFQMKVLSTLLYHLPRKFYRCMMKYDLLGLSKS
jgi:short-subunit dehydrogenase